MMRNNALYRKIYYSRRRRSAAGVHIIVRLAAVLVAFVMMASYANRRLMPSLLEISEYKVRAMVTVAANSVINDVFSNGLKNEDLTILNRDEQGRITSIETNVTELNMLSSQISVKIQEKISQAEKEKIAIPLGSLFGRSIFAGSGPDLFIRIRNAGNIETDFKSEFASAGINQTKHRIYMHIRTRIGLVGPLTYERFDIVTQIPIAETVIVGDVPDMYLSMER